MIRISPNDDADQADTKPAEQTPVKDAWSIDGRWLLGGLSLYLAAMLWRSTNNG